MKIFKWLNRRPQPSAPTLHHVWETARSDHEADTKALLKHAALGIEDWKYGLLSIGTLGLDQLGHFVEHMDCITQMKKQHTQGEEKVEEVRSTEITPCSLPFPAESNVAGVESEKRGKKTGKEDVLDNGGEGDEDDEISVMTTPLVGSTHEMTPEGDATYAQATKKSAEQRTTLADLFLADSDGRAVTKRRKRAWEKAAVRQDSGEKTVRASVAQKLTPLVKDGNLHTLKMLRQAMRKMLTKKIHPEPSAEVDNESDGDGGRCLQRRLRGQKLGTSDRVALLRGPDAIA